MCMDKNNWLPVLFTLLLFVPLFLYVQKGITGFFISESGSDFDAEMCISKGEASGSGDAFEYAGSIGCPIGGDLEILGDGVGGPGPGPGCNKVNVIKVDTLSGNSVTTKSGRQINVELTVEDTCAIGGSVWVRLKQNPPEGWKWKFCTLLACSAPGDGVHIIKVAVPASGSTGLFMYVDIPSWAPPGNYKLVVIAEAA